jgi:hypothetical protein
MLREAGFGTVSLKGLEGDFVNSYCVARPT